MPREILTCAEIAAADRTAIAAGTPGAVLMARAGKAVADVIVERFERQPVTVLCGPGNNGGDGYVIASELREHGWTVRVEALGPPTTDDARDAAKRWGAEVSPLSAELRPGALYVDALFGAGLSKPLTGAAAQLAGQSANAKVVAVDVPSGLAGDTGQPLGAAFEAVLTVTFHRRKPAHVLEPGRSLCGEVVVADIGLGVTSSQLWENEPSLWLDGYPWPTAQSHKHARGRLVVVSGEAWKTGAARLAARGGLRIGAGLVTVLSPPTALAENAAQLEAIMLAPFETDLELGAAAETAHAAVIGPGAGVGPGTRANLLALARTGAALVVDADALTSFRDRPEDLFSALDRDDVLTPHPGEFERLFPDLLKSGRLAAARAAAREARAIVLLKGPDTVIAAPDGRTAVNVNGSPWLATAGSGDVLAGFIGGLLAQGMDSFEAACAGAWIHCECAALHGPGLTAEDLPALAPPVLARLYAMGGAR
ncbi:MAG TPA: NAD(P)H-hydrate dehydratase [Caulobacteraceae bacterium]|nr:NAD(P)H-hydrate dehydratase [Caulobacteraceae bacterium]